MKKLLLICSLFLFSFSFSAQAQFDGNKSMMTSSLSQRDYKAKSVKGAEKIKQLKNVYMTRELNLKNEEHAGFWLLYNKYEDALSKMWTENRGDRNAFEVKSKQLQKEYRASFQKVLGSEQRAEKVYEVESEFREMLKKELKERRD